jgi:LmbE family N-acetylglucosaminyl deacetylase
MKKLLVVLLAVCCQLLTAHSQAPQSWTSADMYLALRKLNVLGSVLYVAAHPDDENTRLIAYFSKDKMYRTGYLSLTRGDGGQNLIGDEQAIELGLIRTQELLSARRIDGGEQFFSRAYDFGYSKTPEETFTKWDREKILSDVVWVIRKFQPDVIITRFPTTGEGGHGHHTASAILANEAFKAAADPTRFPEQLKAVKVWQAKRILWNGFNFGGNNNTPATPDLFRVDVGGYNPLLGKSYGEIAAESRSQHKSQGFGVPASRGESMESFKTTGGDAPVNELTDGVDMTWKRVKGGEAIQQIVDSLITSFDLLQPGKSVKGLVRLYTALYATPDSYWKIQKLKEIKTLIEQCSGLFIDATTTEQFAVVRDSARINFAVNNRLGVKASLKEIVIPGELAITRNQILERNKNFNRTSTIPVVDKEKASQPYWLSEKMAQGYFNVSDQNKIGQPDVDPAYLAIFTIEVEGYPFHFTRAVKYKFTDPVRGELYEPFVVLPRVLITPDEPLKLNVNKKEVNGALTFTTRSRKDSISIQSIRASNRGAKQINFLPSGLKINERNKGYGVEYKFTTDSSGENEFTFSDGTVPFIEPELMPHAKGPYWREGLTLKEIKYDHIPYINYFIDASVKNVNIDLKTYNKKIGYIIGAGDKVPEALSLMGYEVTLLGDKELSRNNLSQFDAIITGVRAYNTNEWMNNHYDKLMKYVNEGGNLIVQYNTSSNIGPVRAKIAPYPMNISRTRITDENAAVTFLKPEHPVLNFPNKITQEDFKGWIQERSIYHAADWEKDKFETILSMSDPGEKPEDGSLVIAQYGKGYFTYTGLVFFRELPAGVPGAYRLIANIIALNKKKAF